MAKNKLFLLGLIYFLTAMIIMPLFRVGLVADMTTSYKFLINNFGWSEFVNEIKTVPDFLMLTIGLGRSHFATILLLPIFHWWQSLGLWSHHLASIFFTLLSVVLFYALLMKIKLTRWPWPAISIMMLPLLFQIRTTHDPFIIFAGQFQMFMCFFFASAWFWTHFLQKNKFAAAIGACVFFSLGVHSHEANIMLWPAMLIIFWLVTGNFITKKIWPLLVMALSCLHAYFAAPIWQFLLRIPPQTFDYSGTAISWELATVIKTWAVQTVAALPLNFPFSRTGQEALSYYPHLWLDNLPVLFLAILTFGIIAYIFYQQFTQPKNKLSFKQIGLLTLLGLSIWILPALPVALSVKNQLDLMLFGMKGGVAYVMVYYQYFGVAILAGLGFYLFWAKTKLKYKKYLLAAMTLTFAVIFYITYTANLAAVKQINKAYDEWRFIVTQAEKSGFFDTLNDQEINLYLTHREANYYQVDDDNLLLTQGLQEIFGAEIKIKQHCLNNELFNFGARTAIGECSALFEAEANNYFLYYDQIDEYSGYVIIAPVTGFFEGVPTGTQVQIYYLSTYLNNNWPGTIYPALRRDLLTSYYAISTSGVPTMRHHRQWLVRDRETNSTVVTFSSDEPILLDSLVPQLVQDDRQSYELIAPVD